MSSCKPVVCLLDVRYVERQEEGNSWHSANNSSDVSLDVDVKRVCVLGPTDRHLLQ